MEKEFPSKYPSQLRGAALAVGLAAPTAVLVVAIFGPEDQLFTMFLLALLSPLLIDFYLRRAKGKSVEYGSLTVAKGISSSEISEVDVMALWLAVVYVLGLTALAGSMLWL